VIARDWLKIEGRPWRSREELEAEVARSREGEAARTLCDFANRLEARVAFLAGRLRRLRAWIKRLPKPAGAPKKLEVGKRRRRQLRAAAKAAVAAAAAKQAAAEAERGTPVRVSRKVVAEVERQPMPDGSLDAVLTVKITRPDGRK
jgi:hypothetical protein